MPLTSELNLPTSMQQPTPLTLDSQKRGVITLIDKSKLPRNALEEALNCYLYEDGNVGPAPGVDWFGSVMPNGAAIDGYDYFDNNGAIELVAVAGGTVYRSTNHGQLWEPCTGATLTTGSAVFMNQVGGVLNITTKTDYPVRYNGTTVLLTNTAITPPTAPVLTATGITGTGSTYSYKVVAVNAYGYTEASPPTTITVSTPRSTTGWDSSHYIDVTHAAVTGALRYEYYISDDATNFYYVGASDGTSPRFRDDGTGLIYTAISAPTTNTTQGEKYEEYTSVGNRQFGIRHATNRYQIGYTSDQENYSNSFNNAFGGGAVSWQKGGKYIPLKVADYRDGKGTPLATIWCDSADGTGCIIQMSLDSVTIGDQTFQIPSLYKLPGSRGTPAPGSVVNVLNDYYFYNSQAIYNIGSRPNLQQILSTDEVSANIRPTVKQTTTSAESGVCAFYFDARVLISVPRGSTKNNVTMVYDTERNAWLPSAINLGFSKFLRYTSLATDGTKTQRLLALKPGDTRLSEISAGIQGQYGLPFATSVKTGLYPISQNRFEFAQVPEAYIEVSNPQGQIFVELLGIERNKGFSTTKSQTIQNTLTNTGWSTRAWTTTMWTDTSDAPSTYSESSVKRYFTVQKELNAVQWHISTNSLEARYVMRTLQTMSMATQAGPPRNWRLI